MMSIIKNLKKSYGLFHLDVPYWNLNDQGVTALVGQSGSGKTSILRILSGLDSCSGLEWKFQFTDLAQLPVQKRRIGFVFQSLELFPHLSAYENIRFGGVSSGATKKDIDYLIESLNLLKVKNNSTSSLSRGEAQRVAIARSLMSRPQILFLDEPFSSLDEGHQVQARELIQQIVRHYKIPCILVSHNQKDVQALAHTVVELKDGKIIKEIFLKKK